MTSVQRFKDAALVAVSTVIEGNFSGGYAWVSGSAKGSPASGAPGIRFPLKSPIAVFVTEIDAKSSLAASGGGQGNQGLPIQAQVEKGSGGVYDIRLLAPSTSGFGLSSGLTGGNQGLLSGIATSGIRLTLLGFGV